MHLDHYLKWERAARNIEEPEYTFPDDELGMKLMDLYFTHLNPLVLLLHRPTFERNVMQGLHLRNPSFGTVYLLVCAVASRYSDDPRVFLDGIEDGILEHSAGWKYFQQVQMVRMTLLGTPCLEDLQTYCVSCRWFCLVSLGFMIAVVCVFLAGDVRSSSMLDDRWNWDSASTGRGCSSTQIVQ